LQFYQSKLRTPEVADALKTSFVHVEMVETDVQSSTALATLEVEVKEDASSFPSAFPQIQPMKV
jgi:hypothetical protein